MFATLRRSWPVLVGFLLFLLSAQEAAAILQEAPDTLPVQPSAPALVQTSSPAANQVIPKDQPSIKMTGSLTGERVETLDRPDRFIPAETDPANSPVDPSREPKPNDRRLSNPAVPPGPPSRLVIPSLGLDVPVIPAETKTVSISGQKYQQWKAPDRFAAGWHTSSAVLGQVGNTVLNGHHNIKGEVFKRLEELSPGDQILVYSFKGVFTYEIANTMIFPEKYEQLDTRMNNAQWILPSQDERLTLVTCWPYESNTHRLIIVARPIHQEKIIRIAE